MMTTEKSKPIHTILLDASPILLNNPSISTLTATCTRLVTIPAVIAEIKGEEARTRFETLYKPFVEVRSPKPESVKHVKEFARRTGDLAVLSGTDLEVLALAYDLECERNGGDWRLRNVPGQKRVNGKPPTPTVGEVTETLAQTSIETQPHDQPATEAVPVNGQPTETEDAKPSQKEEVEPEVDDTEQAPAEVEEKVEIVEDGQGSESNDNDDDDEGWITPSNIKRKQAQENTNASSNPAQKTLQAATITGDFAMQNVLLQMNLNLLSTSCARISHIKQTIFRCHACFQTCKDMNKQFCPRCGKPTLTRVTTSTNDRGEVKLHLKQNYQWNNRGNVFSVPKPTGGTANGKWKGPKSGGGQGGWGNDLVLAEDQKEFTRAKAEEKRTRGRDLMDQDILPGILTGERKATGKIQVGAGRNVNAKKRK